MKISLLKLLTLLIISWATTTNGFSQILSAYIGIDGLTCSLCSNTVEKSIEELAFVKEIKMNLNETTAYVYFKENAKVDLNKLAKKVKDAGYSLRFTKITLILEKDSVQEGEIVQSGDLQFYFISLSQPITTTSSEITLIGRDFIARKEFSQWKSQVKEAERKINNVSNIYFVTN
ncbi:MAG TPA: heavy metal-associated domain-containing protein [Cytophagaceae bacterium]